nr:MAG TPA: helix-turn-helix domain protein [Caudoviricetes sp.]DAK94667.1 MAG TPA: helix-turn-helix domain protein [Caudoviricetes sp.]
MAMEVINTDLTTIGGRIWAIREAQGMSRRAFSERLGCQEQEIKNIEYGLLKKPEQKESLYRNIAATFDVSLDWIKTGEGDMYGADQHDEIAMAFGSLAARHDPVIDGFIQFLRGRTPEQLEFIAQQLRECVDCIEQMTKSEG